MDQKATVDFDPVAKTLTIRGELLPATPGVHDILRDLVMGPTYVNREFRNANEVLSYSVSFGKSRTVQTSRDAKYSEEVKAHLETKVLLAKASAKIEQLEIEATKKAVDPLPSAASVPQFEGDFSRPYGEMQLPSAADLDAVVAEVDANRQTDPNAAPIEFKR